MSNIKVTHKFNKNGRMTGYGKRTTGNARKFLSVLSWQLAWAGRFGEFDKLYRIIVADEVIGFARYNESTREVVYQMNNQNIEVDVDMRKAIREVENRILINQFAKHDVVLIAGETAEIVEPQKRIEDKWQVLITYHHVESILVPLSRVQFVM